MSGPARITQVTLVAALLWFIACGCPKPTSVLAPLPPGTAQQTDQLETGEREQLVPTKHPEFAKVEGAGLPNQCKTDDQCFVGGCGGEVCTASDNVYSTCREAEWPSKGGLCGCLKGFCRWYRAQSEPATKQAEN